MRNGIVSRVVPALNFLVADRMLPNGGHITHTHIHVGPVRDHLATLPPLKRGPSRDPLFEPPATAVIQWLSGVGGIVAGPVPPKKKP